EKNYVHLYDNLVQEMMEKPVPGFKRYRCVTPSWDNTARRREGANIFLGSTPEKYQRWLESALAYTRQHFQGDEAIVFVNAWNEWAEGNHLEPDQVNGRSYLEATRRALQGSPFSQSDFEETAEALRKIREEQNSDKWLIAQYEKALAASQAELADKIRRLEDG